MGKKGGQSGKEVKAGGGRRTEGKHTSRREKNPPKLCPLVTLNLLVIFAFGSIQDDKVSGEEDCLVRPSVCLWSLVLLYRHTQQCHRFTVLQCNWQFSMLKEHFL